MLVATDFFGSDIVKLPNVPSNSLLYVQYKIDVKEHTSLSKPGLPCHKKYHYKMHDCLEEYFQNMRNCHLPWREAGGDDKTRECQSAEDLRLFKVFYLGLLTMSQQDVYNKTGCYNSCTYKALQDTTIHNSLLQV